VSGERVAMGRRKVRGAVKKDPSTVLISALDAYEASLAGSGDLEPWILEARLVESVVFVTHQSAWRGADMMTVLRFCRWFLRKGEAA
jgi:hypothetical protein